MSDPQLEN
jgi:hypothetical protein